MASVHSEKPSHIDNEKIDGEKHEFGESQDSPVRKNVLDVDLDERGKLNAIFENPLAGVPREQLLRDVEDFCQQHDLMEHVENMKKGALAAQSPWDIHNIPELTPEDVHILEHEQTHKWDQPWRLYWLVSMASLAAAVQGMDET